MAGASDGLPFGAPGVGGLRQGLQIPVFGAHPEGEKAQSVGRGQNAVPEQLSMASALSERANPKLPLLTDSMPIVLQLVEDGTGSGRLLVRGEFARSGNATENKRVYSRQLWEREIKRLRAAMRERRLFGELDHPSDGRTQLTRASHLITNLGVEDDGQVVGEAEVLGTSRGRDLRELLEAGCKVGVSSRGYGSVKTNDKGEDIVQEDYQLVTFDFVAEPADSTAYPEPFSEDKERQMGSTDDEKQADQEMAKKFAERVQQEAEEDEKDDEKDKEKDESLRAQFEADILSNLGQLSAAAREQIRSELMADPQVARAKAALEQVKSVLRPFVLPEDAAAEMKQKDEQIARLEAQLKEKDLQIRTVNTHVESLSRLAKEAGYKYFLERSLAGFPDREEIRTSLGDLNQFENAAALKARVDEIVTDLVTRRQNEEYERAKQEAREKEIREAAQREAARLRDEADTYRRNANELKEALEKSLEANRLLGVQLYAEQRLATHPRAKKLRRIMESAETREDVDRLIDEAREPVRTSDELESIRSRVRAVTAGGRGPTAADEEKPRPKARTMVEEHDYNGLGIDLGTLKKLSNLPDNQ